MNFARESWTSADYAEFIQALQDMGDENYKRFNDRIIPNTPNAFGIRVPALRGIAKEILRGNFTEFLALEKGTAHEEIIIEGLVAAGKKCGFDELMRDMHAFSEKIYNWAICDTVIFKGLRKFVPQYIDRADEFLCSDNPWKQRFGLGCLMQTALDSEHISRVLTMTAGVKSSFYYVRMMQAWLTATAAAKCPDRTRAFIADAPFDTEVMNMTLRKIKDSRRITDSDKEMYSSLIKGGGK